MSSSFDGLDKFRRKLEDISRKVKEIDGEHSVPIKELLTPDFLARHSSFSSSTEMFEKSGYKVESQEDFSAIPDEPWDEFIRSHTSFNSWKEMLQAAGGEWAKRKIGL